MEKLMKLEDEREIKLNLNNDVKKITESFSVDGLECAYYSLEQNGNFSFSAELDIDSEAANNHKSLLFIVDINHPLFFSYYHLLNGEKEIRINDSKTDLKYLSIKYDEDAISLNFVDKLKKEDLKDKYKVELVGSLDYLSSIEAVKKNDFKERLRAFFDESTTLLLEDSHQITMEEYTLRKSITKKERLSS